MLKISDAVLDLITGNPSLHFGMHHRLLNLSQVARFIRPMIEARTQKSVQPSAILMCLSRMQKKLQGQQPGEAVSFYIDRVNIHSGLYSLTLTKSRQAHREVHQLFNSIQEDNGYITVTEGNTEITVIIESEQVNRLAEILTETPRQVHRQIAGLGVKFKETYTEEPGLLYQLLQQLALQNINVVEVASTMTEFNIYLHDQDLLLAFDSIYNKFSNR